MSPTSSIADRRTKIESRIQSRAGLLEAHIRTFINCLRVEKGLSDNTVRAYRRDIEKFAAFAGKRSLDTKGVQRSDVVDFLANLYRTGLDSRSVARHLVTIRHFFRFALIEGYVEDDPAATIESPRFSPEVFLNS